ncbi:1-phosphofructokinase [Desulfovibrio gilichinskyi]|uniref:1-phosphofructokinase n=1 Tax=Desulfovibrio gilichinskyi TaxID=1519643 RepID=A0A1X7CJY3_9BACT|nr:1-phosphofructokinase [Desulfovibrio gilichinskyi]SME98029.1 fructose-1-phosphate kinase [Desulfovibrio gilichinskyi]
MKNKHIVTVTMNPAIDLACSVPDFTAGKVNRATEYQKNAAGKGVNIAVLLRKFNLPITATGFLGADNALIFEKLFKKQNINDQFVRVPGETRTGIKILDPNARTTTDINLPGLVPEPIHIKILIHTVERLAETAAMVVIGGSLPATVDPSIIGELVAVIKSKGAKAIVDTSGPALSNAVKALPYLVKPNDDELAELVGHPLNKLEEIITEARKINKSGIETVIVSLGSRGALFIQKDEELFAKPPKVEVVSTVGAGDAMIGGMVAGMALGLSLEEQVRLATSLSAATVTQAGPSLDKLENAEELEDLIAIEHINIKGGISCQKL